MYLSKEDASGLRHKDGTQTLNNNQDPADSPRIDHALQFTGLEHGSHEEYNNPRYEDKQQTRHALLQATSYWDDACTKEDERIIRANLQRWRQEYEEDPNKLLGQGELARKAKLFMDQKKKQEAQRTKKKTQASDGRELILLDGGAFDHVIGKDLEEYTMNARKAEKSRIVNTAKGQLLLEELSLIHI